MNTTLAPRLLRLVIVLTSLGVLALASPAAAFSISTTPPPNSGLPRQWFPGGSVTLSLDSTPVPIGAYQWLHDEQPIVGATAASLTLTNLASLDSGNYRLRVTAGSTPELSINTLTLNILPPPTGAIDSTFVSALPIERTNLAVGPFAADGSFIVTNFPPDAPTSTVRLTHAGAVASGFSFPATAGIVLAGFPDGRLLVSQSPYRLNADGTSAAFTLPASFDATKPLTAAVVTSDGGFYLAQGATLARFLADGSVDATFAFAATFETGISGLQLDRQNRLYIHGRRAATSPYNYPQSWAVLYRVAANGAIDTGFAEQTAVLLVGSLQVTPLDDGRILYYSGYHGYRSWRMLRDDGTADPSWTGETTFSERPIVVNRATNQVYLIDTSYKLRRYTLTATSATEDTQFYPGTSTLAYSGTLTLAPEGKLLVYGNFTQWEGYHTQGIVRLRSDAVAGVIPPNAFATPTDTTPSRGDPLTIKSTVTGTGPFTYQWLALDGQPLPADTTSPQLVIPSFSAAHLGRYQIRVTGPDGVSVLSNVAEALIDPIPPYLANLSGRALSGEGEDTIIAGLSTKVSAGALGVPILIRGAGPALQPLGVTNYLPNPALDLYDTAGLHVANNDQWSVTSDAQAAVTSAAIAAGAFSFEPASNDAALLRSFHSGNATVMLKNQGAGSGIGLLEIYQLFPSGNEYIYQSLLNLSLRARTGPGESTAIAGFVIVDPQNFDRPAKVLLRAVGPTLATQGIQHPLADPVLTVYNSRGEVVARNDNWPSHLTAEYTAYDSATDEVGAFHLLEDSKDAGLLLDLPAGAYTMHATGGSGVVLLEIYLVR